MRKDIEGVAFDLDGTLYRNYRFNILLLPFLLKEWRLLSAFGKARKIIRQEQEISPAPRTDFYEYQADKTAKVLGVKPQSMKERIDRLIYKGWEPLFKKVKLFDHAVETLSALRKAGYKLGLMSDFPPETKLEYLGISGIWDSVLCSENFGVIKPHRLPFTELADAMSLPCEKILYVGNSYSYDIVGAERVGMKTAWVTFFPAKKKPAPDFIFSNYRKLFDFMVN